MKNMLVIYLLAWIVILTLGFAYWPEDMGQMYHERYKSFMIGWEKVK